MNNSESKYFHTAVKLDQALIALLEKKEFAYITVSEICREAKVNRSTFYLHYENTMDLLEETTRYVLDKFLSYFETNTKSVIESIRTSAVEELNFIHKKYLFPYLYYIEENQKIIRAVLSQPMLFRFDSIYEKLYVHIFDPILERFQYPNDQRHYVMMFYLNGITAIITQWLKEGCKRSVEEISQIIEHCIFGLGNEHDIAIKAGLP